jgi:hypothetical protein
MREGKKPYSSCSKVQSCNDSSAHEVGEVVELWMKLLNQTGAVHIE